MALNINLNLPTGVVATYHKVAFIDLTVGRVTVVSYIDETARRTGKQPVTGFDHLFPEEFSDTSLVPEGVTPLKEAYRLLKNLAEYAEAANC